MAGPLLGGRGSHRPALEVRTPWMAMGPRQQPSTPTDKPATPRDQPPRPTRRHCRGDLRRPATRQAHERGHGSVAPAETHCAPRVQRAESISAGVIAVMSADRTPAASDRQRYHDRSRGDGPIGRFGRTPARRMLGVPTNRRNRSGGHASPKKETEP